MKFDKREKHPFWKGYNAGYSSVHYILRQDYPPPDRCPECGEKKPLDLCCKNGVYKRNIRHFKYMCKSCHIKYDKSNDPNIHKRDYFLKKGHHGEIRWNGQQKGWYLNKSGSYTAYINKNGIRYHLGSFKTKSLARREYLKAMRGKGGVPSN